MDNNSRYDLSDRLIHFFRPLDLEKSDAPPWPEDLSHASINETYQLRPYFLLRHAVRLGRLYATWSVRGGRRTIYGLRPAVCFTEMPIAAFVEAGRVRAEAGQAMSPYGLAFRKTPAFRVGARPVIYGLSTTAYAHGGANNTPRLLDESVLPGREQYRYVAYDPTRGKLDWSHEREWRWPLEEEPWSDPDGLPPGMSDDLPGLDLDLPELAGIGVIVATPAEAEGIVYDVLTKIDRGDIPRDHYQFVLAHEAISDWGTLRDRGLLDEVIADNAIDIDQHFQLSSSEAAELDEAFAGLVSEVFNEAPAPETGEPGGCWLWLLNNMHPLARALVATRRAQVNREGKYLVDLTPWGADHNLRQREHLAQKIAGELAKRTEFRADYFSVLSSADPDNVPFYNGDQLDDRLFYNWNDDSTG